MAKTIDDVFSEWVGGLNLEEARIYIFSKIRDIPYAVIPELNEPNEYIRILDLNKGSCTPKHFLLYQMYHRLGLQVLYSVFPTNLFQVFTSSGGFLLPIYFLAFFL